MFTTQDTPRSRFGVSFVLLARRWRRALDHRLAEIGLTDATWAPLIHLQDSGDGISQKDLAALLGIDGSSLVRLLDILAARGLLERRTDKTDRRAKLIFLTDAGRDAVVDIRRLLLKSEAEMLTDLSDDEITLMLGLFTKIDQRLHQITT